MNKKLFFSVLFLAQIMSISAQEQCSSCSCKASNKSFFSRREIYTINSPEYLAHSRGWFKEHCGNGLQVTVLGGKSTNNENLANYFSPFCSSILNVSEAAFTNTDILASQLNIYTASGDFQSTVQLKPHHSYVGIGLNYQKAFYETDGGHAVWWSISGPILRVRNRIELIETITTSGGGPAATPAAVASTPGAGCPAFCPNSCNSDCSLDPSQALAPVDSVAAAFRQPSWCFGRIDSSEGSASDSTKTRIGDITLRLGYETVKKEDYYLDSFVGCIIPTGNTPKAINIFEPVVGQNHHWGIVLGNNAGIELWKSCTCDSIIYGKADFSITYLFSRNERRSFDLKYKPWSRYMQFYRNVAQAQAAALSVDPAYQLFLHTPGIDILTQDLRIKPGFYRTLNVAVVIEQPCIEVELGYNFFARQAECVNLACPFPAGTALKAIDFGAGQTGRFQTINNNFGANCLATPVASFSENIITTADLDLESAAHPAMLAHTVYASAAHRFYIHDNYPLFVALGGSYEFSPDNTGMNRWMAWGKFTFAF